MSNTFVDKAGTDYGQQRGFQGLRHDEESGLIENRNRMLDPTTGRFVQRDPLGYPDGMNGCAAYHVMWSSNDAMGLAGDLWDEDYVHTNDASESDAWNDPHLAEAHMRTACANSRWLYNNREGSRQETGQWYWHGECQKWRARLNDLKKGKEEKKSPIPGGDFHGINGAYYAYTIRYGGGQTAYRYGWTHDIRDLLSRVSNAGCCLESFMISTHQAGGRVYCDSYDTGVDIEDFASSITLCDGATVDLNVCNGGELADLINDNNPGVDGIIIEYTDGENRHWPITGTPGIDLPGGGGDTEKIKN